MTANDPTHHYIKYNWESHSEALRATASRLTEQRHQVRLRKRRRDLPAAFNVILTAIEVLEGYSGSELYIPTNNNLFSEGTRRNAAYTTEVRDALKHLIDSGYLVQAAARQQKFNKDTRRLFWLPHRYRLGERWFKEIGVAPMSKPHEIRRNPLLGYVELRKRRDVHGKRVNMPKVISPQQGKKYRNMLTETAHVLKAHEELMAVTQVALGQRPLPSAQFYLTRIFSNVKLSEGGRTYCSAQGSIKKHERPYLYFNNETTVELDINAIHAHLCYLKCKASFSGDPYTIDGFKRDKVKVAFNIMLNRKGTKDNKSAALTISNNLDMPLESAQALESAILDTHAPIASMFNSGAGLVLQRLDSDIALQVLKHMVASGIATASQRDSKTLSCVASVVTQMAWTLPVGTGSWLRTSLKTRQCLMSTKML
jgi:hypothetical protein